MVYNSVIIIYNGVIIIYNCVIIIYNGVMLYEGMLLDHNPLFSMTMFSQIGS